MRATRQLMMFKQQQVKRRVLTTACSHRLLLVPQLQFQPKFIHTNRSVFQQQEPLVNHNTQHEEYIAKSLHAKRLFDDGRVDDAIQYLLRLIESSKSQLTELQGEQQEKNIKGYIAAAHSNLAFIYQTRPESVPLAVQHFKQSLELNPDDPVVYENLGALFYEKMNKRELAIPMLKKAVELDPDYVPTKHRLAKMYSDDSNTLEQAEKLLRECIKQEPRYYNASADLSILLLSKTTPDANREALELIDQVIKYQEEEERKTVGMTLVELEEYQERKGKVDGHILKGYAFQRLHRFEDAGRVYKRQIEILSKDRTKSPAIKQRLAEYHLSYAIVLDQDQKKEVALTEAEKAFQIDPYNGNIVFTLARLLEKNGRLDEAEHIFLEMLKVDPKNDTLYGALVNIYMEKGKKQTAIKLLKTAIQNFPELKHTCGEYLRLLEKRG